jgi:hypothetical protein
MIWVKEEKGNVHVSEMGACWICGNCGVVAWLFLLFQKAKKVPRQLESSHPPIFPPFSPPFFLFPLIFLFLPRPSQKVSLRACFAQEQQLLLLILRNVSVVTNYNLPRGVSAWSEKKKM